MALDVMALICGLGRSYQDLLDNEIIPYKSPPKGFSGDPDLSLDMAKEGVYLSFRRNGRVLKEIIIKIQNDKVKNWCFPNDLPLGLQNKMSKDWVHKTFGKPLRSVEPKIVMRRSIGRADLYSMEHKYPGLYMQIRYDLEENVQKAIFFPESELLW